MHSYAVSAGRPASPSLPPMGGREGWLEPVAPYFRCCPKKASVFGQESADAASL